MLGPVGRRERLGEPFGFVVATAGSDRVDISPVALGLRVDQRIAVGLRRRGQQVAGTLLHRQTECVQRAQRADLHGLDRHLGVVDRRCGRSEVQDVIDRFGDGDVVRNVEFDQSEAIVALQVGDILRGAGGEIVQNGHVQALGQQAVRQVRAQETRPAGQYSMWPHGPLLRFAGH